MKHIATWLNEKEYKAFMKFVKKKGVTPYALTKDLIVKFLEEKREEEISISILYWFILYSLVATALILLL